MRHGMALWRHRSKGLVGCLRPLCICWPRALHAHQEHGMDVRMREWGVSNPTGWAAQFLRIQRSGLVLLRREFA